MSSVRISAVPKGAIISVDGTEFSGSRTFLWQKGSKHVLNALGPVQYGESGGVTRFSFSGWSDSTNLLTHSGASLVVTADPAVAWVQANFTVEHLLRLEFYECPAPCTSSPGRVTVSGQEYMSNTEMWIADQAEVSLLAQPNTGFVFLGWRLSGANSDVFVNQLVITQATVIQPRFAAAKRVRFATDPPELQVHLDRQPVLTPVTMDWAYESRHVLGAPSPQSDQYGVTWVFDSWSQGGGQNTLYVVQKTTPTDSLTAKFVRGVPVTLRTVPAGLKLNVDGRENWPGYSFTWGVGHTHDISAPAEQKDAAGRRYVFKGWSNGGPAAQTIAATDSDAGSSIWLTAEYEALGRMTFETSPAGLLLTVDGVECRSPCTVDKSAGSEVRVAAAASFELGAATRLDFEAWSDSPERERLFQMGSNARLVTARYRRMHRLDSLTDPVEGAVIRTDPVSPDSFYSENVQVVVSAEVRPGFRFRGWEGDLSGPYRTGVVPLNAPRYVRAVLDRVPYLREAGVRNAAGETPEPGVASGSLISIYGASLAAMLETGPASPLVQTIGGVTVRVGDRYLPLLFVSPEQVNALLPSDLPEGTHGITVRWEGKPEAVSRFEVVRNAPGLFGQGGALLPLAVAVHEDGTAITLESPARRGETVSVFGTGFGPYTRPPVDGFPIPERPDFPLADPVEILAGDARLEAASCVAAPGQIGVVRTRFHVPADLASGNLDLRVRVNGRESNTVQFPVE